MSRAQSPMRDVLWCVTLRYADNSAIIIVWRTRAEAQRQFDRVALAPGSHRSVNPIPWAELPDYIQRVKQRHPATVCVCLDGC